MSSSSSSSGEQQAQQQEQEHGAPREGAECQCCWEDLDGGNYVEYRAVAGGWVCGWMGRGRTNGGRVCACARLGACMCGCGCGCGCL